METNKEKKPIDSNTKKVIAVAVIVIIALLVVIFFPKKENKTVINKGGADINSAPLVEEASTPEAPVTDQFKAAVPADTIVPDVNTQLSTEQKKIIAVPTNVMSSAPGSDSNLRTFDIKAEAGVFTPSQIIARVGDIVHINFTAVDKNYDIVFPSYNMSQTAKAGQTKILEFSAAEEGNFTYYCNVCGGATSTAKGNIIIVK